MKKFVTILLVVSMLAAMLTGCGSKKDVETNNVVEESVEIDETKDDVTENDVDEAEVGSVEPTDDNDFAKAELREEQMERIHTGIESYRNSEYINEKQNYRMDGNSGVEMIEKIAGVGTSYKVYANDKLIIEAYKDDESAATYIRNYDKVYAVTNDELTEEEKAVLENTPMTMERHFTKDELDNMLVSDAIRTIENTIETISVENSLLDISEDENSITLRVGDELEDCMELTIVFEGDNITGVNVTYTMYDYKLSTDIKYEREDGTEDFEIPEEIKANAQRVNSVSCFIIEKSYEEDEENVETDDVTSEENVETEVMEESIEAE